MADDSVLQLDMPSVLVTPSEPVEQVLSAKEAETDAPDELTALLEAHKGDPDWSEEELEKARNDPHAVFDPSKLKSPGEFNRASPLYTKIKNLKSKHSETMFRLEKQIKDLEDRQRAAEEQGYKRALEEIQSKRLSAVEYGDKETFKALDEKYNELQQEHAQRSSVQVVAPSIPVGAEDFFERNAHWIQGDSPEDVIMHDEVEAFEQRLLQRRMREGKPPLNTPELVKHLEEYAKAKFPHRFENPKQRQPAAVESASSPRLNPSKQKASVDDLNEIQKQACSRFMKNNPGTTAEEYIRLLQNASQSIEFK